MKYLFYFILFIYYRVYIRNIHCLVKFKFMVHYSECNGCLAHRSRFLIKEDSQFHKFLYFVIYCLAVLWYVGIFVYSYYCLKLLLLLSFNTVADSFYCFGKLTSVLNTINYCQMIRPKITNIVG